MDRTSIEALLPFAAGGFTVRARSREDINRRADWPPYPEAYSMFNTSRARVPPDRLEAGWARMKAEADILLLSAEHPDETLVATFSLRDIDWAGMAVGNMGVRLHPGWCDRGVGSALSTAIFDWCLDAGFRSLRLDVLGSNGRARRCYEKAGMAVAGSFERDGAEFLWMERRADSAGQGA